MPQANGEFVKVYLYLLRCANTGRDLSLSSIADALEHPERHQQLVIRVCGYSARFVDLSREMQQEIANRAQRAV